MQILNSALIKPEELNSASPQSILPGGKKNESMLDLDTWVLIRACKSQSVHLSLLKFIYQRLRDQGLLRSYRGQIMSSWHCLRMWGLGRVNGEVPASTSMGNPVS